MPIATDTAPRRAAAHWPESFGRRPRAACVAAIWAFMNRLFALLFDRFAFFGVSPGASSARPIALSSFFATLAGSVSSAQLEPRLAASITQRIVAQGGRVVVVEVVGVEVLVVGGLVVDVEVVRVGGSVVVVDGRG
jgi:hypothetical protein